MRWWTAVAETTLWEVVLCGLYTVLISTVDPLELLVGALAALLGALAARPARRSSGARTGGAAGLWPALWRWPFSVLADTWRLAVLTLRPSLARPGFRDLPLPERTGAAWALALYSATPGGYAVAADPARVHVLADEPRMLERALTGRRG
ncbi:Na+/H+ antiporter subunit E [Kitasatospora sp. NPDC059673]|uniref:Na+/H+ antiporter subunit E n=1 Tax=Kitasatospora sp. NPDC059673 TaxID=3346901 RepID=UPI00368287F2